MLPVIVATAAATFACVALHGEVVCSLSNWSKRSKLPTRLVLPLSVLVLLATHLAQVLIYAAAHFGLERLYGEHVGVLAMAADGSLTERVYFSGVVFSTLGFGDIVPAGPIRLMVAVQAITGLMLIAWSAALTYSVLENKNRSKDMPRAAP